MSALLTILAAVLLGIPALCLGISLFWSARTGELPGLAARWRPLWAWALAAWGHAVASGLVIAATAPLSRRTARPPRGPEGGPVLLIHGLYHNPSAWLVFRRRLERAGVRDVHVFGYNSLTREFPDLAAGCAARAREILAARPGARLRLVGHSLGGLVARAVAADPELAPRVAAVACLGAPHGGSELARLAFGRLGRSLRPGSATMRAAAALAEPPGQARLALYAGLDGMVCPHACLLPPSAAWTALEIAPGVSHVGLIYSREVFEAVLAFLREGRATEAGPDAGTDAGPDAKTDAKPDGDEAGRAVGGTGDGSGDGGGGA